MAKIAMPLAVTVAGQTEQVTAGLPDMIALEQRFGVKLADLGKKPPLTYLAFLAWNALRRTRPGVPAFDKWVDGLEDLEAPDTPGNPEADQPT